MNTNFTVKESDKELLISHKANRKTGLIFLFISLLLTGILSIILFTDNDPIDNIVFAYLALPEIMIVLFAYLGFVFLINKKVIFVTNEEILVKSTPLTTFNAKKIKISDLEELYIHSSKFHSKYSSDFVYSYTLFAKNINNKKIILFESSEIKDLEFLENKIKSRLEINKN